LFTSVLSIWIPVTTWRTLLPLMHPFHGGWDSWYLLITLLGKLFNCE
jgi:hypothetical protein